MAFIKSADTILIKATLTEKGKKLLARGKFKIAKFALGDDEIDYRLYNAEFNDDDGYEPALKNAKLLEAFKDPNNNIQFGLNSYDSGILYLTDTELKSLDGKAPHAFIEYIPALIKNTKTTYAPTIRQNRYYLSVNDETTTILNKNLPNFQFLEVNDTEKKKIIIESGIKTGRSTSLTDDLATRATKANRENLILKKFLLDEDFLVQADNRIVSSVIGIQQSSQFENFQSGEAIINFSTENKSSTAISLDSGFDYFATFLIKGIPNLMMSYDFISDVAGVSDKKEYSNLSGPRGSVVAFNIKTDQQLQVNSTGTRDSRFVEFGTLENALFSEMPTRKFDYIDTTIYIVGATTNSSVQVPIRIIRYAGL